MAETVLKEAVPYRLDAVKRGSEFGFAFTPLDGKIPTQKGWSRGDRASLEQALRWAQQGNIGLRTGSVSGVVVLDVDVGGDVSDFNLPETVTVITGGGGKHYYFRAPNCRTRNSASTLGPKIDFRGDGGQVVYPGSIHPETGRMYEWAPGRSLGEIEIAPLPATLEKQVTRTPTPNGGSAEPQLGLAQTTPYGRKALQGETQRVQEATEGQRNDTLNRAAYKLGQLTEGGELDRKEALEALVDSTDLPQREAVATLESGLSAGARSPRSAPPSSVRVVPAQDSPEPKCTDVGNGTRFAGLHGQDLRYCYPLRQWFVWNGQRWVEDHGGEIHRRAKDTARSIYREASRTKGREERKQVAKWAMTSESMTRIEAMVKATKSEPDIPISPRKFDTDPRLLNVANGTLDLRTFELREHRREDLITKFIPIDYDPKAKCPQWLTFLNRTMRGNQDLIGYLQRIVGYCLTGETSEQCFFIFYGEGANGKSVLLNVIRTLLSVYAEQAPAISFMVRQSDSATNDLAKFRGSRLVTIAETEHGHRLAEGLIKQVTGQDPVTARPMYKEFFTYIPTFKVVLATNHRPNILGTDHAIWRRVRLIPFEVTIPPEEQDHDLTSKLLEELEGILAWAVEGCRQLRERGLNDPQEVIAATEEYRRTEDHLSDFIDECCVVQPEGEVTAASLFAAYKKWCAHQGEEGTSQKRLGEALTRAGYERRKMGTYRWVGLSLRSEEEVQP